MYIQPLMVWSPAATVTSAPSSHGLCVVRLQACQEPERATDGMGGCYFFRDDKGCQVAIFKPCDEEALAPCNPKGFVGRQLGDPGWKATVRVGEVSR